MKRRITSIQKAKRIEQQKRILRNKSIQAAIGFITLAAALIIGEYADIGYKDEIEKLADFIFYLNAAGLAFPLVDIQNSINKLKHLESMPVESGDTIGSR